MQKIDIEISTASINAPWDGPDKTPPAMYGPSNGGQGGAGVDVSGWQWFCLRMAHGTAGRHPVSLRFLAPSLRLPLFVLIVFTFF